MTRTDILNAIARTIGARTYCEIGVRNPADNFDRIEVATKIGVDPVPARGDILAMTSDEYFSGAVSMADLYFIDGLHTRDQAHNDWVNAGARLAPRGVIVLHDCMPASVDAMAPIKPANGRAWNGTVWQAWLTIRGFAPWESYCVPADHGCGVTWRGANSSRMTAPALEPAAYLANAPALSRATPLATVLAALEARP